MLIDRKIQFSPIQIILENKEETELLIHALLCATRFNELNLNQQNELNKLRSALKGMM